MTSIGAGLTLGAIEETLRDLRGLLVLVPAAIAMRGNIFGALGSRLSTSLHTGTFSLRPRVDTVVGQNVLAAVVLTLASSVVLGVLAKATAVAFEVPDTISVADLVVISTVGGLLSSVVVLAVTLALAGGSTRFGWDLDNVTAPLVSAVGDIVTLPALFAATYAVGIPVVTPTVAAASAAVAVAGLVAVARCDLAVVRSVVRGSVGVLLVAGVLTVVAGVAIEKQLETFGRFQVLLVMVPAFLAAAGAIGGILSSRLSTKLHLGLVEPTAVPDRMARRDIFAAVGLALPVFVTLGVLAQVAATNLGQSSPGVVDVVSVAVLGGLLTTAFVVVIGYYGTIAAVRLGADPDNVGIPLVTSTVDLIGAYALVLAVTIVGLS